MRPFQELRVWQAAHELTLVVYRVTAAYPREEMFGLTSQTRRACASVPANIAEGSARGPKEFHQFLRIALGSAAELEYHMILARDLGYLSAEQHADLETALNSIKRMLNAFMANVRQQQPTANSQQPTADGVAR